MTTKKIVSIGIFVLLTLSLVGCSWSQSNAYENTKYGFSLTFPTTWGEVTAVEQKIENTPRIIITSEDGLKDISLSIFEKQPTPITAPLGDVGETDKYFIGYQSKHLEIYNLETADKDASQEKALQEELEDIVATFEAL